MAKGFLRIMNAAEKGGGIYDFDPPNRDKDNNTWRVIQHSHKDDSRILC